MLPPPHLPAALNSIPPSPSLCLVAPVFPPPQRWHTAATNDLLSINLFSGSCSVQTISLPFIFQTVWLLAPSCPHCACHSQLLFPPASSLIISFLSPCGDSSVSPCFTLPFPPLPPRLLLSPNPPADGTARTHSRWHDAKVHLHLCSRLQ